MKGGDTETINPRNGYCKTNSVFYSKRNPISLPANVTCDVTTFISSRPHHGTVAFIDSTTGQNITFHEIWNAVESVSASLYEDFGVRKGDVVLLLSPNSLYFPVVCLAVMSMGAIITTTNPLNTKREIEKQIADSKPLVAFAVAQLVPKLAGSHLRLVLIGENVGLASSSLLLDSDQTANIVTSAAAVSKLLPRLVPKLSGFNLRLVLIGENVRLGESGSKIVTTLEEMMKKKPKATRVRERVTLDDTASLLYSSGTTGASKGVVSSHRNLIAMVQTILSRLSLEEGEQTFICTVPMFHIYGLAAFATGLLASGSTIVILSKFDMDEMLTAIERYRVTYVPLVPPILVALVNNADQIRKKYNLKSMQSILCGGAPLGKEVVEGFVEKYPMVTILQGYGLTESTGVGSSTDSLEESRRYGTAGLLSPSMEAKIVDPDSGEALTVNRTGELWLKGPTIMKGYFCNAEATASTLDSNGWLRTGDLCYIDDDGYIFVVDRLKELIKYKGYQVPPAELESLLLTHPDIVDAAVIPYPDKEAGQFPMAYVVRKAGKNLSDKTVMDFVAKQVAPYKKVRRVAFIDSIPKNPSGKILRKDLIKFATSRL